MRVKFLSSFINISRQEGVNFPENLLPWASEDARGKVGSSFHSEPNRDLIIALISWIFESEPKIMFDFRILKIHFIMFN